MGNRKFQFGLRIMIVIGSMLGFVSSWVLFAHSGKPIAASNDAVPAIQQQAPVFDNQGLGNQNQSCFIRLKFFNHLKIKA